LWIREFPKNPEIFFRGCLKNNKSPKKGRKKDLKEKEKIPGAAKTGQ